MARAVVGWMTEEGVFYEDQGEAEAKEAVMKWPRVVWKLKEYAGAVEVAPDEATKVEVWGKLKKWVNEVVV